MWRSNSPLAVTTAPKRWIRYVGKREQVIEFDAETVTGHAPVIACGAGSGGPCEFVDEIEDEPSFLATINQCIKRTQPSVRTFERPVTALRVHAFFQVHGTDAREAVRHHPVAARYAMLHHKPHKGGCP
jgi:hypothetical protein